MKRIIFCVVAIGLFACGQSWAEGDAVDAAEPFNIVLVVVDTLRADHVGHYGYQRGTTPNVDRLAAKGFTFRNCYSSSSWTLPACTSLLTGLYADVHGVKQWDSRLSEELAFLPQILNENGYYCAGVSSNPFLTANQGFARGFDVFDDETVMAAAEWSFPLLESKYKSMVLASTGATTTRRAMELLNDMPKEHSFFLFVHYMDPHADYVPPAPFDKKFDPQYEGTVTGHAQSQRFGNDIAADDLEHVISLYDGEIAYTDQQIGQLLDHIQALGLSERTCVILTADHGEEFLEHGNWFHGYTLFEECIRVPLIMQWPGQRIQGADSEQLVSLVDVMPTVLGLLNVEVPKPCQGIDLRSVMQGKSGPVGRPVVVETSLGNPLRAIIRDNMKLICSAGTTQESQTTPGVGSDPMLFDLSVNPQEDLSQRVEEAERLAEIMLEYANTLAQMNEKVLQLDELQRGAEMKKDAEQIERLKSLGYIGS